MTRPGPAELAEIEIALLCGATRCAVAGIGSSTADRRLLAAASNAAGNHLLGRPAYHLAMASAEFLDGGLTGVEDLCRAMHLYVHERMPPSPDEGPAGNGTDPDPLPGRSWERRAGLIG